MMIVCPVLAIRGVIDTPHSSAVLHSINRDTEAAFSVLCVAQ